MKKFNIIVSTLLALSTALVAQTERPAGDPVAKTAIPEENEVIEYDDFNDETSMSETQNVPLTPRATGDIFDRIASRTFAKMRFRYRGYESGTADIRLNGIYYNDAMTGYAPYSLWSGLNDVVQSAESSSSPGALDCGLGGINSVTGIDTRPSAIRAGTKVSASTNSAFYALRLMATHSSGFDSRGWAWAASFSTRQGGNAWVNGMYYNAFGYYAGVEKLFGSANRHRLSLMLMGTPTIHGTQTAATQEVYDLLGNNFYNPNWGYQNGKLRNSRVRDSHEPLLALSYEWKIDTTCNLKVNAAFRFGKNGYSAFDWYGSDDPRPDRYSQLPSYFRATGALDSEILAEEQWRSGNHDYSQVNWGSLYEANRNNFFSAEELGLINDPRITASTRRSIYIVQERHADQRDFSAGVQYVKALNINVKLVAGADARINRTGYFATVKDLLGGDGFYDINRFDNSQSDLNNPNRVVRKGDKYGYHYTGNVRKADLWALYRVGYRSVEAFAGLQGGIASMWREGQYRNGTFPDDSYGKSNKLNFLSYTAKAGVTEKLSTAHRISGSIVIMSEAPQFKDAFAAPLVRNTEAAGLAVAKIFGAEVSYNLRLPWIEARVSGFYTAIRDQNKVVSYYDDIYAQFINMQMWGINTSYTGIEAGVTLPLSKSFDVVGALSCGDYRYSSDPKIMATIDATGEPLPGYTSVSNVVRWKNYHVSGTPQTAACIGVKYHSRKMFSVELNGCYYDAFYIDMSPLRRIDRTFLGVISEEDVRKFSAQEKFPAAFLLNAALGKYWRVQRRYGLGVNLNIDNILNVKSYKTAGYEQMRVRTIPGTDSGEGGMIDIEQSMAVFGSKYRYLYGTTSMLNVYFRF